MVKHVICWKLKEHLTGEARERTLREIKTRFEALNGVIPGMVRLEIGVDFSRSGESSDFVLYSEFESRAALEVYQAHPAHKALLPLIGDNRSEKRLVDYETDE